MSMIFYFFILRALPLKQWLPLFSCSKRSKSLSGWLSVYPSLIPLLLIFCYSFLAWYFERSLILLPQEFKVHMPRHGWSASDCSCDWDLCFFRRVALLGWGGTFSCDPSIPMHHHCCFEYEEVWYWGTPPLFFDRLIWSSIFWQEICTFFLSSTIASGSSSVLLQLCWRKSSWREDHWEHCTLFPLGRGYNGDQRGAHSWSFFCYCACASWIYIKNNKKPLTGGFEPPTFRLTAERSADWATRADIWFLLDFVKYIGIIFYQVRFLQILYHPWKIDSWSEQLMIEGVYKVNSSFSLNLSDLDI